MNKELVTIKDRRQAIAYIKHNVKPVDVDINEDDILVFIFRKEDTKELFKLWRQRKLDY